MALSRLRNLFGRSAALPFAANDTHWDHSHPADAYGDGVSDPATLRLRIEDFDLHRRDLGYDVAAELQRLVQQRLQPELTANERLTTTADGQFTLVIRDADKVDTRKLTAHLQDVVASEAFSLRRALIECALTLDD